METILPPAPENDRALPTLLIADDDPVVRLALAVQLGDDFHLTTPAADADEAISIAALERPDVALLDLQMPGGGGMRAVHEITASSPGTAIVILSVDESHGGVLDVLDAGATSYVRKGQLSRTGLVDHLTRVILLHRAP